jgi:hypothetical protein
MVMDLTGYLRRIMNQDVNETFDPATDSLEAIADALGIGPGIGLWMFGIVDATQVASTITVITNNLQNVPNDVLEGQFWMQVLYNTDAPATAPEGEFRQITNFVQGGALQTFTVDAFTANVEAGDYVAIFHESLLPQEILAQGTLDTSSATVPEDSTRPEGADYFKGCLLMTTEGAVRFQPRRIVTSSAAGVFTLDPNNPFTAASGLVDYIIIGSQAEFVPAADAVINRTPADVVGGKADTPIYTPDDVSSIIRYLKGILATAGAIAEPGESFIETWQDLLIDANIWTVTDPAGGAAWNPSVSGAFLDIITTPNADEFARLVSQYLWQLHTITPNLNLIVKKTIIEWTMTIGVPANVDNTITFFGWIPNVGNTRANDNIIGFCLLADVLCTLTDSGGTETVNTTFGEDLTLVNKFRIEVYEGNVDFYLNEVRIAQHTTNIPNVPSYPNFCIDTEAGGACALSIGIIKIWYEMVERY